MGMSLEATQATMLAYGQAILAHGAYADYFSDDVLLTVMNDGQTARGREAVEREVDAQHGWASEVRLRNMIVGAEQAVAEADFVGKDGGVTPYSVVYDLADGKITALRLYFAGNAPN